MAENLFSRAPFHVGTLATNLGYLEIGDANAKRIATLDLRDYYGRQGELWGNAQLLAASADLLYLVQEFAKDPEPARRDELVKIAQALFKKIGVLEVREVPKRGT